MCWPELAHEHSRTLSRPSNKRHNSHQRGCPELRACAAPGDRRTDDIGSRRIVAFDDTAAIVATSRSSRSFTRCLGGDRRERVLMSVSSFDSAQTNDSNCQQRTDSSADSTPTKLTVSIRGQLNQLTMLWHVELTPWLRPLQQTAHRGVNAGRSFTPFSKFAWQPN
jgi:hypothetical protein